MIVRRSLVKGKVMATMEFEHFLRTAGLSFAAPETRNCTISRRSRWLPSCGTHLESGNNHRSGVDL